jgi:hypothetical protein
VLLITISPSHANVSCSARKSCFQCLYEEPRVCVSCAYLFSFNCENYNISMVPSRCEAPIPSNSSAPYPTKCSEQFATVEAFIGIYGALGGIFVLILGILIIYNTIPRFLPLTNCATCKCPHHSDYCRVQKKSTDNKCIKCSHTCHRGYCSTQVSYMADNWVTKKFIELVPTGLFVLTEPITMPQEVLRKVNQPIKEWRDCACTRCACDRCEGRSVTCGCSQCRCKRCSYFARFKYCNVILIILLIASVVVLAFWTYMCFMNGLGIYFYMKSNSYIPESDAFTKLIVPFMVFAIVICCISPFFCCLTCYGKHKKWYLCPACLDCGSLCNRDSSPYQSF